jgi:DNA-binding IclR family transcriptional regulator
MSNLELACLSILRIFGPCSNADVGRKLGIAPDATYRAVKALEQRGLAVHPKLQRWDISELGRDYLRRLPAKDLTLFNGDA